MMGLVPCHYGQNQEDRARIGWSSLSPLLCSPSVSRAMRSVHLPGEPSALARAHCIGCRPKARGGIRIASWLARGGESEEAQLEI